MARSSRRARRGERARSGGAVNRGRAAEVERRDERRDERGRFLPAGRAPRPRETFCEACQRACPHRRARRS